MRATFCLFFLTIWLCTAFAQKIDTVNKTSTVFRDTINVCGYIVDTENHPLRAMVWVNSNQQWLEDLKLKGFTDKTGRFELKGIKPFDTINVNSTIGGVQMTNNGARYLKIIVPKYMSNFFSENVHVFAKRTHFKILSALKSRHVTYLGGSFPTYEMSASPVDGMRRFVDSINSQMHYTAKAIDANIEGSITVAFHVRIDGSIGDIEIIRGLGYGLDEQLINAIQKYGKWHAALFLGDAVTSTQNFSVKFKLTDK